MNGNRIRIYGLQLPHPSHRTSNVPLSLGYLASYLHGSDLAGEVQLQIAPSHINDYMGDAKLLEHLEQKKPDILAFSVYPWNLERTLYIAGKAKAFSRGKLRTIFGGPEIHPHNPMLAAYAGADYLVTGEGEIPFYEIVRQSLKSTGQTNGIKSSAFWDGGEYCWNHEVDSPLDLAQLPSPYLQGILSMKERMAINIFSYRGCHFNCSYCQWRTTSGVRMFARDQVLGELSLALSSRPPVIYLSDAAINLSPAFDEICCCLAEARPYHKSVRCFVHLSSLTNDQVRLLHESGIQGVEVGLQSIDQKVNQGIHRHFEKEKFEYGISLLKKHGVRCLVDIIIGLPYADKQSIQGTIDYVRNLDLDFSLYHLSVSSGCRLYREKDLHSMKLQPGPPYYVISTSCLTSDEMHDLYAKFSEYSADQDVCLDIAYPGNVLRFFDDAAAFDALEKPDPVAEAGITDWIVKLSQQQLPTLDGFLYWLGQSASKLSIWLLIDRLTVSGVLFVEELMTCLTSVEHSAVVNIFIQTEEFEPQVMGRLGQLNRRLGSWNAFLTNRDHFVADHCGDVLRNDRGRICLITTKTALARSGCRSLPIPALKLVSFRGEESIDEISSDDQPWSGYCVNLPLGMETRSLLEVLSSLKERDASSRQIYFCHPVVHRLWLQKIRHIFADPMYRHILLFKDNKSRVFHYNDYDLALEAILNFDMAKQKTEKGHVEYFAEKVRERLQKREIKHVSS
jgi:hypothetical protein